MRGKVSDGPCTGSGATAGCGVAAGAILWKPRVWTGVGPVVAEGPSVPMLAVSEEGACVDAIVPLPQIPHVELPEGELYVNNIVTATSKTTTVIPAHAPAMSGIRRVAGVE